MPTNIQTLGLEIDSLLTSVSRGYGANEFIGDKLFPVVTVDDPTGKIPLFGKDMFRVFESLRAMRADSNEMPVGWLTTTPYETKEHDLEARVDYLEERFSKEILSKEMLAAKTVGRAIELGKEIEQATLAQDPSTYPVANVETLTDNYWNEASVDWIKIILDKKETLVSEIGEEPTDIVIPHKVWKCLMNHAIMKSYMVQFSEISVVATIEKLSKILGMNILVGKARYTPTKNAAFTPVWTNNIVMAYVAPPSGMARDTHEPCFAYTLQLKGFPVADTYNTNGGKIHKVRYTDNYTVKVVGNESGLLIANPIDPAVYALA